jgi:hypothetical protein
MPRRRPRRDGRRACSGCGAALVFHAGSGQHACSDPACAHVEPEPIDAWLAHRRAQRAERDWLIETLAPLLGYTVTRPGDDQAGARGMHPGRGILDEALTGDE